VVEKMVGFTGKHYVTLDAKGRIVIPAAFREYLSVNYTTILIFTNDAFDRCLCAYTVDEWKRLMERVKEKPQTLDAVKYYMRRVIGSAVKCEIDKQGRVLIPPALRIDAGLNNEVVLLGLGNRMEVWDKSELENIADPKKIDKKAYMQQLSELGL
jgi:MraZ protein